ncbi:hypothetical protein C7B82_09650 [Stenomitos frigidus ULC18]|uniref:Cysteine dioxygenase n=2 Tax=Stenomitos TaxID=1844270 RepID=A0A2T1EBB2_9CYAN|nr:hypothetical protein C7B82_09650 [Stenomitos frigidus ULC18]
MVVAVDYRNALLDEYHIKFCQLIERNTSPQTHSAQAELRGMLKSLTKRLTHQVEDINPEQAPRKMLRFCDQYELFLLDREPYDHSLLPHDHGRAWGMACVISGALKETTYQQVDSTLVPDSQCVYTPGDVVLLHEGLIHVDSNPTPQRSVSLNLFVPCIVGMKVYVQQEKRVYVVKPGSRPLSPQIEDVVEWQGL